MEDSQMGNPQLKNGYTRIANELLEALCSIRIRGESRQIFDVIIRKTYGFNKKEDCIPLSQFVQYTGIKKPNVIRAIAILVKMNLIVKKDYKKAARYSINKNYHSWNVLSRKKTKKLIEKHSSENLITKDNAIINSDNDVIKNDNELLSEVIPSKDTTKENPPKDIDSKERRDLSLNLAGTVFESLQKDDTINVSGNNDLIQKYGIDVINRAAMRKSDYYKENPKSLPKDDHQLLISLAKACKCTIRGKNDISQFRL